VVELASLWLPILITGFALFFASFVAWMVLQLHKNDWNKMPNEVGFMDDVRKHNLPPGNYMFPMAGDAKEQQSPEFQQKFQKGPAGTMSIYPPVSMGKNLGLTFLYFLATAACLAYLATLALPTGAGFLPVFRFVATAALMVYLSAMIPQSIWFKNRIVGHVIESVAFAIIAGAIFAGFWPAS